MNLKHTAENMMWYQHMLSGHTSLVVRDPSKTLLVWTLLWEGDHMWALFERNMVPRFPQSSGGGGADFTKY